MLFKLSLVFLKVQTGFVSGFSHIKTGAVEEKASATDELIKRAVEKED